MFFSVSPTATPPSSLSTIAVDISCRQPGPAISSWQQCYRHATIVLTSSSSSHLRRQTSRWVLSAVNSIRSIHGLISPYLVVTEPSPMSYPHLQLEDLLRPPATQVELDLSWVSTNPTRKSYLSSDPPVAQDQTRLELTRADPSWLEPIWTSRAVHCPQRLCINSPVLLQVHFEPDSSPFQGSLLIQHILPLFQYLNVWFLTLGCGHFFKKS